VPRPNLRRNPGWLAGWQAAVLLSAGSRGHRYSFPHAKISTAPPVMNRVFGQVVDAQLQVRGSGLTGLACCVGMEGQGGNGG
jgi:hypothetical protein